MLTLPTHLACSSFHLLTLEIFIEAVVLQLGRGIARLTKASPFSLTCAPLITLNLLQVDCLLLYQGAARAGEPGVEGEGRAGQAGQWSRWQGPCLTAPKRGEQGTSTGSHQGQMQPSDCRHIHSNEAGLRSSQEVSPQVRINNVAQAGTKGKCRSLNTAPEPTGRGPDEAPHSPFHGSPVSKISRQRHVRSDPALEQPSPQEQESRGRARWGDQGGL